jgi:hypothetical protein
MPCLTLCVLLLPVKEKKDANIPLKLPPISAPRTSKIITAKMILTVTLSQIQLHETQLIKQLLPGPWCSLFCLNISDAGSNIHWVFAADSKLRSAHAASLPSDAEATEDHVTVVTSL